VKISALYLAGYIRHHSKVTFLCSTHSCLSIENHFVKSRRKANYLSHELQNVRIFRQNLVTKMSLQMLILRQSRLNIYHFLAEYCNFQKNIGPIEDSMAVFKTMQEAYVEVDG